MPWTSSHTPVLPCVAPVHSGSPVITSVIEAVSPPQTAQDSGGLPLACVDGDPGFSLEGTNSAFSIYPRCELRAPFMTSLSGHSAVFHAAPRTFRAVQNLSSAPALCGSAGPSQLRGAPHPPGLPAPGAPAASRNALLPDPSLLPSGLRRTCWNLQTPAILCCVPALSQTQLPGLGGRGVRRCWCRGARAGLASLLPAGVFSCSLDTRMGAPSWDCWPGAHLLLPLGARPVCAGARQHGLRTSRFRGLPWPCWGPRSSSRPETTLHPRDKVPPPSRLSAAHSFLNQARGSSREGSSHPCWGLPCLLLPPSGGHAGGLGGPAAWSSRCLLPTAAALCSVAAPECRPPAPRPRVSPDS